MKVSNLNWKIGGEAGFGILSTGNIFSRIFSKKGYYVIDNIEYPSLVRGGHNTFTVRVNIENIYSLSSSIDMLVALNQEAYDRHRNDLQFDGVVIYDSSVQLAGKTYAGDPFTGTDVIQTIDCDSGACHP